jgi:HEAT repeat protein
MKEGTTVDREQAEREVRPAAVETLSTHPDPAERIRAASEIGGIGGDDAIDALIHALRDPVKEVRASAGAALTCIGIPALGALIGVLADGNWVVRYRAAEALGGIRDSRSVTALIHCLCDGQDHVRYIAAKGLGKLGDGRAEGPLTVALSDENPFVRRAARDALAVLGAHPV